MRNGRQVEMNAMLLEDDVCKRLCHLNSIEISFKTTNFFISPKGLFVIRELGKGSSHRFFAFARRGLFAACHAASAFRAHSVLRHLPWHVSVCSPRDPVGLMTRWVFVKRQRVGDNNELGTTAFGIDVFLFSRGNWYLNISM